MKQTSATTTFTESGPWTGGSHAGAFQGDYRLLPQIPGNAGLSPAGTATYAFVTGTGAVYATWPAGPTHTDRARYRIVTTAVALLRTRISSCSPSSAAPLRCDALRPSWWRSERM